MGETAEGRVTRDEFARQTRGALAHAYDLAFLQRHPLTRYVRDADASEPRGSPEASLGRGLQRCLSEAIDALAPAEGRGSRRSNRGHELLTLRYLEGLAVAEVCARLGVSTREFYREHQKGLDAVCSILWQRWGLDRAPTELTPATKGSASVPLGLPSEPTRVEPDETVATSALTNPITARVLSSFVGRERELTRIRDALGSARLVTLVGPPGTGKTRLAQEAAARLADDFPGGVIWVPLSAVTEPGLVLLAIARALGLDAADPRSLGRALRQALAGPRVLLILDNFEQVVDAAPDLVELLVGASEVRALATSQVRLNVRGEHVFPVPPLAVPSLEGRGDAEVVPAILEGDATGLFVERAREVDPAFDPTPAAAWAIAAVCARLDGLPLAIELAAARVDALSPTALLAQLDGPEARRLDLLAGGARDLPLRQQTLRGAIAWSDHLLPDEDRVAFRRLSVIPGSFTLDLADAVLGTGPAGSAALDRIESLVRKSLLRRESLGEAESRYGMLETIRAYGREGLAESGELAETEGHLAEFGDRLARTASERIEELPLADQRVWFDRLERELPNLRAVLGWYRDRDPLRALGLAVNLAWFWHVRGYDEEGVRWLEGLLAAVPPNTLTWARGVLALDTLGKVQRAEAVDRRSDPLTEALAVFRDAGDVRSIVMSLIVLSWRARYAGDVTGARARLDEAYPLARASENPGLLARVLVEIAVHESREGSLERAWQLCEESLELRQRARGDLAASEPLAYLGNLARMRGDYALAERLFEQALEQRRVVGHYDGTIWVLALLANVARLRGDADRARRLLRETIPTLPRGGALHHLAIPLFTLGLLDALGGEPERGVRRLSAARWIDPTLDERLDPDERADLDRALDQARAALGPDRFDRAVESGRAATPDQIREWALAE